MIENIRYSIQQTVFAVFDSNPQLPNTRYLDKRHTLELTVNEINGDVVTFEYGLSTLQNANILLSFDGDRVGMLYASFDAWYRSNH